MRHALNADQIAARIATDLALPATGALSLLESLGNHAPPPDLVVLIDAVDEATNPVSVRDNLLLPLTHRGLRVILGARRHVLPSPATAGITLDLDTERYHDPDALTDYVSQLLAAAHEPQVTSPYRAESGAPYSDTATVAAAIAERATSGNVESFLIARVMALALRARPERVDPSSVGWTDLLPDGLGDAFEEDLARLGSRTPNFRVLLEALAWARGPGLPWETIWVPVAQALADLHGDLHDDNHISDEDVRILLNNAGAYIVEDLGPGERSVFRPFHEVLSEYLRRSGISGTERDTPRIENAITHALLDTVPTDSRNIRRWERIHPYLLTYLAEHAHAASTGVLENLLRDGGFLVTADPITLTPLLFDVAPVNSDIARTYRRARPLLGNDLEANAAYLQESATDFGVSPPVISDELPSLYQTVWTSVSTNNSVLTLTGHLGAVSALAFGTANNECPVLASAGEDGTVRIWNPDTGAPVGNPLKGHTNAVWALAFCTNTDGHPILASAGEDGNIQLWNLDTREAIGNPLRGRARSVWALAFGTTTEGRPILASSSGATLRLWNPDIRKPIGDPIRGHKGAVRALALVAGPR
jgi:hypothetical protein